MRIIHLMNHCGLGHGNVHAGVDLACAQAARGDMVWFASGHGEFVPLLTANGVHHVLIDQRRRKISSVVNMLWALRKLVREVRPDIIHAHMMTGAIIGWLVGRISGVKLVTTVHNAFERHAVLMTVADRVVAVSQGSANELLKLGFPRQKLRVVLNGTHRAIRRDFFPQERFAMRHPSVGSMSGLHARKGIPDLIEAFTIVAARSAEVFLYIAGDGPSRAEYETMAAASDAADRIRFLGEVRDTKSFYGSIDIFVLNSHADPGALVVTEARVAGCAIVATDVGGSAEALSGGAGMLVPPRRPDLFADALLSLLEHPEKLERMKRLASQNLEQWSVDRVAADYDSVYREALQC
jgi:glycosyltransferase involved in cell wall biosynthesis